ncbi:3'-5' exonuclease [Rhodovulum sp. MB263]|uniref:3'-5' exonuclease n=1 Tax=Rhodovulum sp. (strain MB263) TaxID=308754 RepID=UPI0009B7705B|nr:3'-5' exonuclease [Rhodovulum sp. MB263]ARC89723.1 DNA helicase UvrD [Rhodovulum sp. MB263]
MKHLKNIVPSSEQLKLISGNQTGAELIRGSAGSGKTTTALLRLKSLKGMMRARKDRIGDDTPVKVLLLTFNRTLAGYVRALAESQVNEVGVEIEIRTFAKWSMTKLGVGSVSADAARNSLHRLANRFEGLEPSYVVQESEYLMGRFEPNDLESYISAERTGRGALPRVEASLRRRLLDEVIYPYYRHLADNNWLDWNSLAIRMRTDIPSLGYDVIIVDESQDFSANEIRAIKHHLADEHAVTFVIDTAQRIYARGFTWAEAGIDVTGNRSHRLRENHRNTKEIAAFASSILAGITVDTDGVLPNLDNAKSSGPLPKVISGKYSQQIRWALEYIRNSVDLDEETVAFLKPEGGRWFDTVRCELSRTGLDYVEMQRNGEWPAGDENIALCTFHSAKGLEFDHVIIIGFNQENTYFGDEERTDQIQVLRRLLAVAVARARKQVIVGYKPGEESRLTDYFDDQTYEAVPL